MLLLFGRKSAILQSPSAWHPMTLVFFLWQKFFQISRARSLAQVDGGEVQIWAFSDRGQCQILFPPHYPLGACLLSRYMVWRVTLSGNVEHVFEQVACRTKTTNRLMFWVLVWRFIIGNINSLLELVVYLQVVCAGRSAPDKACPEEQGEACLKKPKRHTESVISARLFVLMLPCDYSRSDVVASQHARSLSR